MSCIVYQTDKKTGTKYAYESISYWDKEKQQPRSKRKYLGRVDPKTGEILTSRRKKSSAAQDDQPNQAQDGSSLAILREKLAEKESQVQALRQELRTLSSNYKKMEQLLARVASMTNTFMEKTDA